MSSRVIHVVNPVERSWTRHRYVLWFGACGPTLLMVWANSLDDAIEECGAWLAEHAPGHIVSEGQHTALCREACEDAELAWPPPHDWCDEPEYTKAIESAEADLTYTEAGWLVSYEWGIWFEDPTRAQLMAFAADHDVTFAYKRGE